ncbi:hypothetical protein D8674_041063 [Pyrus ussuriensis x Pyrus communis]|uniref:Uncharacterized protein n=1 Tax=Pyrus ussuriensis x Pyrus communis TaxID=2448454 RepID=A0A5N5FBT0_9ROSA|nr:hypothetical protein D8674_041063 [Pyrus ussuriensis x Pyrus communis]
MASLASSMALPGSARRGHRHPRTPDTTSASTVDALGSHKEKPSWFLSLNRVMGLDSLEVDLSKQLTAAPAQPQLEVQVEAPTKAFIQPDICLPDIHPPSTSEPLQPKHAQNFTPSTSEPVLNPETFLPQAF